MATSLKEALTSDHAYVTSDQYKGLDINAEDC